MTNLVESAAVDEMVEVGATGGEVGTEEEGAVAPRILGDGGTELDVTGMAVEVGDGGFVAEVTLGTGDDGTDVV